MPCADHLLAGLGGDGVRELQAGETFVHVPVDLLVFDVELGDAVERAQDLLVGFQAEGAQEDRTVEFALAVDTDIEDVLVVVLELDPASAIRNDLAEEVALRLNALEEHARGAVQLRNDDALGAVDDERSVVRHQRNFAEEDFLLLDVADGFLLRLGILGVDGEPDGDLERSGIRHAALLALLHVVFQLQTDRVAALVAERDDVLVERAAMVAENVAGVERVGADGRSAVPAGGAKVMQSLQVAAFAFPVAD